MFWECSTKPYIYIHTNHKIEKMFFLKTFRRKLLYVYIYNKFITLWTSMFKETVLRDTFPSLGLIKHNVINLLYYEHWTDKQIYIYIYIYIDTIYISVTQKVPKSSRSNVTTWVHAYSPSSLPPPGKIPPPPNFYSLLAKIQFPHPPLNKNVQVIT